MVGEQDKCLYGTRDVAQGWERVYVEAMKSLGFRRGRSSPCIFYHPIKDIKCTVHGDDFFSEGLPEALTWFENSLLAKFEGKVKGRLAKAGDELRVLNRVVRRTSDGYEWEADQWHVEILGRELGLTEQSKPVACPGRKIKQKGMEEEDSRVCLSDARDKAGSSVPGISRPKKAQGP